MSWGERSCKHKPCVIPNECSMGTCDADCRCYEWDGTTKPDSKKTGRRFNTGTLAMATTMAALGLSTDQAIVESAYKLLDEIQETDELKFLNTLSGEPKKIWTRRVRAGLRQSELDFIRSKLQQQ